MWKSTPRTQRLPSAARWRRLSRRVRGSAPPDNRHRVPARGGHFSLPSPTNPVTSTAVAAPGLPRARVRVLGRLRRATPTERREWLLAFILLCPALFMLGLFVAYPFVRGLWLSLLDSVIGREGDFVGVQNYVRLWHDSIF